MSDTQIVESKKDIKSLLIGEEFKKQVATSLPKHLKADRFVRISLTALTKNPKLLTCTPASFFKCLLDLSSMGLEPDGRRAHLIPYGDQCTLIIDYKGLVELVLRSGEVLHIHADVVCENDVFSYNLGQIEKHEIDFRKDRGAMYAAYAIVTFKDEAKKAEVLSRAEVDAVRKRSKAGGSGPWVTDYNEMAKKTAFRRLSKWLPLSADLREKIEIDDQPIEIEAREMVKKPIFKKSEALPPVTDTFSQEEYDAAMVKSQEDK